MQQQQKKKHGSQHFPTLKLNLIVSIFEHQQNLLQNFIRSQRRHHQLTNYAVLQVLNRRHEGNRRCIARSLQKSQRRHHTSQPMRMLCKFSTELTTNIIRRCFASPKQTSQRQSPMYCKIFIEVTKTSPHQSTNENALQVLNGSHNQHNSPMFCQF